VKEIPPPEHFDRASHTHSAPDCYGFPDGKGDCRRPEISRQRLLKNRRSNQRGCGHLQPAGLKIATGEAKEKIAYNYYAEQLYDPRCHVIQAIATDGQTDCHAGKLCRASGGDRAEAWDY